jgi:hypothetical protein
MLFGGLEPRLYTIRSPQRRIPRTVALGERTSVPGERRLIYAIRYGYDAGRTPNTTYW